MGNMKISSRLLLGFGITVALTLLVGWYALQKQQQLRNMTTEVENRDLAALQTLQGIIRSEDQMRRTREGTLLAAFLRKDRLSSDPPEVSQREWSQARD